MGEGSRGSYLTINVYFFLVKIHFIRNFAWCGQHSAWYSWHCNQDGVADTAWGRLLYSLQFILSNSLYFQLFKWQKIFFSKKAQKLSCNQIFCCFLGGEKNHFYFIILKASFIQIPEYIERQRAWQYRLLLTCLEKCKRI